jgi:hypothetical protein
VIPIQDIDIHTDKSVFYKLNLIRPSHGSTFVAQTNNEPFSVEVLVYDSEFNPPYFSAIRFPKQFAVAEAAFEHGLRWILGHTKAHKYSINRINNPCNCEFLDKTSQATVLKNLAITATHQVNGA